MKTAAEYTMEAKAAYTEACQELMKDLLTKSFASIYTDAEALWLLCYSEYMKKYAEQVAKDALERAAEKATTRTPNLTVVDHASITNTEIITP